MIWEQTLSKECLTGILRVPIHMKISIVHRFLRHMLITAFCLSLLPQLSSQTITHDSPATDEQLSAWLHSGNPRLVAWAATLARERKDTAFIALLPEWLKQSPLIADYGYSPKQEDSRAYDAVLDALVRGNDRQTVEPGALRELGRTYPAQAFLLMERLPADQQLPALKEWFSLDGLSIHWSGLAKLAAMRLAQWPTPVPGFAARIVSESEEQFTVELRPWDYHGGSPGGAAGACADSMYSPPALGWPVVYVPFAEESQGPVTDATLITLDDDHVIYHWVAENSPGGTCNAVSGLDQQARHEIVAHWLGQTQSMTMWQPEKSVTIIWRNRHAFDSTLGSLIAREEENFGSVTERLVQSGLLSKDEAAWVRPKLVVRMICHIDPCPIRGISKEYGPQMWTPF